MPQGYIPRVKVPSPQLKLPHGCKAEFYSAPMSYLKGATGFRYTAFPIAGSFELRLLEMRLLSCANVTERYKWQALGAVGKR